MLPMEGRFQVIRNKKVFDLMQTADAENDDIWPIYAKHYEELLPHMEMAGGLDHINVTGQGVYFHDIGVAGRNHSFVIKP